MDFLPLSEMFILLYMLLWQSSCVASPRTYEVTDSITGRPVQCDFCPPGTFLRASCSSIKKSECTPCPRGSFTGLWNYIGRCLRCGVCGRNQVMKKECTAESDCHCECKQGYFYRQDFEMCFRHSECPSGHGVLTKGTADKDTVCGLCSDGTFSDISSTDSCTHHRSCSEAGLQLVLKGAAWHDSVCANCTALKDAAAYLKDIIPAFFIHHKIKLKRLRRTVLKLPSSDVRKQRGTLELSFPELHKRISSWVSSATPMEIQQLPAILNQTRVYHAGEKLQKKLNSIKESLTKRCHLGVFGR